MTDHPAPLVPAEVDSKPKRKAISKTLRFEVFKRDGFACQYCGAAPPGVLLQVDHIKAVVTGGTNEIDNLVTACQPCNLGKGVRSLKVAPQSLEAKARETAEREAQLAGFQAVLEAKRQRLESETWRVLEVMYGPSIESVKRDYYTSTQRFIQKLGVHACLEAAEIAMSADVRPANTFRYFCGVCWNKVRETN